MGSMTAFDPATGATPAPGPGGAPRPAIGEPATGEPAIEELAVEESARRARARRTGDAWRMTAIVFIWLTSLFVVALWVAGGGIEALFAFDSDTLTTLGRITGLVAANLLLYQVLLLARIPLFERGFGHDGLTRMHRLVGFWSFWLMLGHIVLITLGYAAESKVNPILQLWQFVVDYPAMLLATAGTLLLILVVVTSLRRARSALRYESWHLLHLYAYLGVGFSLPHMLWTGNDFLTSLPATVYWWTLWAVAAAAILLWRVVVPVVSSLRHRLRVVAVEPDGVRGVTVRMRGRRLDALGLTAGQFLVWRFLDGAGWMRGHPYSLAAAPAGDELEISVRLIGDGSRRLRGLRPGIRVLFEGPYGVMTGERRTGSRLFMIGAGAGVAPLVAVLDAERTAPGVATLLVRDHVPEDALRGDAIARLVAERGLRYARLDGHRSHGGSSWIPESHAAWQGPALLRYLEPQLDEADVFVCGPDAWMKSVLRDLDAAGVAKDRIHVERFTI
jgi:predicted ferric reductase